MINMSKTREVKNSEKQMEAKSEFEVADLSD